jgi:ADP-heptose:LPS heptosyltransferase
MAGLASAGFKNILVIRLRAFGDTLLTTPTLRGLKQAYPQAKLSILLEPAMAAVVQGLPYVDEVVPFDRQGFKKLGTWGELKASLKFYAWLRRQRYDLVLDVLGTPRTAAMTLATGAATRVGFSFRIRRLAYTVVHHPSRERRYIADFTADLLRALGHEPDSLKLDFRVSARARTWARDYLRKKKISGKPILLSPAGGWELKRYPMDQFRQTVALLCRKARHPMIAVWGPGEESQAQELAQGTRGRVHVAPPTDFAALGALLERSCLFIGNDGANKHLAVAVGTPSLTIFGPTSDIAWHPPRDPMHRSLRLDLDCMPCEALTCRFGTQECLKALAPERVARAALEMLK